MSPLLWVFLGLMTGLVGLVWAGAPGWAIVSCSIAAAIVLALYLIVYVFYLCKNPDLIRSEEFILSQFALRQSLKGDSLVGFYEPTEEDVPKIEEQSR